MNVYDAILKRRSIRKFKCDAISDEIIKKLLIAAMAAPSARNMQPWEFYVISNKEVMSKIRNVARSIDFESPLMIIVCGNTDRSITKNDNDFWIQDCSAAIENILLTATSENLGTVWCGIYPVMDRINKVTEIINLPKSIIPLGVIHIGYKDEEKEERTQYNDEYVHYIN